VIDTDGIPGVGWLTTCWSTTCVTVFDVLGRLFASSPYTAVTLWVATLREEVVKLAAPLEPSVPVPSVLEPSLNVTVPVGLVPLTFAVNVTAAPEVDGFAEDTRLVLVEACPMVTDASTSPQFVAVAMLLASPLYAAIQW
jgi:hypothetical protein